MKKTGFWGLPALACLLLTGNAFAQNPILRSTTSSNPTSFLQVTPSVLNQKGNFIGLGTNNPTQRLTISWYLKEVAEHGGSGVTYVNAPPVIRFEHKAMLGGAMQYWHLTGEDDFSLSYENTAITPMKVQATGEVSFMNKVNLSQQTITTSNDNRLGLYTDNNVRRIFWTSYTSGSNNAAIPLEFTYDAMGTGAVDVSVMKLMPNGNVGIGGGSPAARLHVSGGDVLVTNGTFTVNNGNNQFKVYTDGKVRAREILVDLQPIPDYVFGEAYPLMGIAELKAYIAQHKHLPGIKSEAEYVEQGNIPMGELNLKLLEKVEELTLYIISLKDELEALKQEVKTTK